MPSVLQFLEAKRDTKELELISRFFRYVCGTAVSKAILEGHTRYCSKEDFIANIKQIVATLTAWDKKPPIPRPE